MRYRFRLPALIAAAGLISLSLSGTAVAAHSSPTSAFKGEPSVLTAAQVRQLAAHATDRSIIIFKNQLSSLPVRGATMQRRISAANAAQAPVMNELATLHATHVQGFHIINAIAATISSAEAQRLRANPAVQAVVPDALQRLTPLGSGPGPVFPAQVRHGQRGAAASGTAAATRRPATRRSRSARATRPSR